MKGWIQPKPSTKKQSMVRVINLDVSRHFYQCLKHFCLGYFVDLFALRLLQDNTAFFKMRAMWPLNDMLEVVSHYWIRTRN